MTENSLPLVKNDTTKPEMSRERIQVIVQEAAKHLEDYQVILHKVQLLQEYQEVDYILQLLRDVIQFLRPSLPLQQSNKGLLDAMENYNPPKHTTRS